MWISSNSLDGRTALVTGAGRGLGQAIALNLAQAGARGALLGRSGGELDQTAKQVREFGAGVLAIQADVGDPGQLSAAARRACGDTKKCCMNPLTVIGASLCVLTSV